MPASAASADPPLLSSPSFGGAIQEGAGGSDMPSVRSVV